MCKLYLLLIVIFILPLCSAQVYINEVVPDPTDDCMDCTEWLELYNSGDEDVDVANWTLKDSKDRELAIEASYTDESTTVLAGGYLVIYPGKATRKIWLTNKEDTIKLFDAGVLVDEASYSDFNKDYGIAWARSPDGADNWIKTAPTRGGSNKVETEEDLEIDGDSKDSDLEGGADDGESNNKITDGDLDSEISSDSKESTEELAEKDTTGKTVYVSSQKKSLTKPLLLLLLGLLVIVIALQLQLMSQRRG